MNYMNYMITIWIGYMETQSMQWHEIFQTKPIFLYSVFCLSAQVLKCSSSARVPECLKCSSAKEPKCSSSTQVPLEFPWSELRVSLECPWGVLLVPNLHLSALWVKKVCNISRNVNSVNRVNSFIEFLKTLRNKTFT